MKHFVAIRTYKRYVIYMSFFTILMQGTYRLGVVCLYKPFSKFPICVREIETTACAFQASVSFQCVVFSLPDQLGISFSRNVKLLFYFSFWKTIACTRAFRIKLICFQATVGQIEQFFYESVNIIGAIWNRYLNRHWFS